MTSECILGVLALENEGTFIISSSYFKETRESILLDYFEGTANVGNLAQLTN